MKNDPIVGEIHKVRKQYAERFGNNLHAICEDARRKQGRNQRAVVPANPKSGNTDTYERLSTQDEDKIA